MSKSKIRVLIAKVGLDGHDRGALVIAQALRDHGMEVIYTGLRQTPAKVAQAAIQEDVNLIGLSSLSGAHNTLFPKVVEELVKRKAVDIPVIAGGVIPAEDIPFLLDKGINKVFTSGTSTTQLVEYIDQLVHPTVHQVYPPKKIAHIGIAVYHMEEALPFYTDTLGLELEDISIVQSEGVKVAFLKIGESKIELLEPLNESSPIQKFLNKKGEGIHHIALEVDNISERIAQMKRFGIKLVNEKPKKGANQSDIVFLHPHSTNKVLFELCQPQEEDER